MEKNIVIYFKFSPSCGMLGEKEASRFLISSFFLPFPHFSHRFASFLFIFLQRKKVQQYVQCRASRLKVFFFSNKPRIGEPIRIRHCAYCWFARDVINSKIKPRQSFQLGIILCLSLLNFRIVHST